MSPSRVAFQACSISMGCMKFTQWESEVNLWQQARVFDRLCFHHCMVAEVKFALVYCHLGVSGGWGVKRHWAVVKVETVTLYFQSMSCLFYKHKIPLLHLTRRGNKHKATSTMNAGVIHRTVRDLVLNHKIWCIVPWRENKCFPQINAFFPSVTQLFTHWHSFRVWLELCCESKSKRTKVHKWPLRWCILNWYKIQFELHGLQRRNIWQQLYFPKLQNFMKAAAIE